MSYVTVSAKVKREFYEKLKQYNVRISEVIRRALEEEVKRREEEEAREKLATMQEILVKIPREEIVETIRKTREEK